MPPTIMSRGLIVPYTRTRRSIARSSASVPSRHTQFSVAFTTNIAESNFRYTQPVHRERKPSKREEERERLGQRVARVAEENAERNAEAYHGPRKRGQVTHAKRESTRPPRQQGRERPSPVAGSHQKCARQK